MNDSEERRLQVWEGDIIVAMEAARNINLADIGISSLDLNLLDIDDMATRLGVSDTKGKLRVDSKTFKQIQEMLNQPKRHRHCKTKITAGMI